MRTTEKGLSLNTILICAIALTVLLILSVIGVGKYKKVDCETVPEAEGCICDIHLWEVGAEPYTATIDHYCNYAKDMVACSHFTAKFEEFKEKFSICLEAHPQPEPCKKRQKALLMGKYAEEFIDCPYIEVCHNEQVNIGGIQEKWVDSPVNCGV